jgi:hypothetical protein
MSDSANIPEAFRYIRFARIFQPVLTVMQVSALYRLNFVALSRRQGECQGTQLEAISCTAVTLSRSAVV